MFFTYFIFIYFYTTGSAEHSQIIIAETLEHIIQSTDDLDLTYMHFLITYVFNYW